MSQQSQPQQPPPQLPPPNNFANSGIIAAMPTGNDQQHSITGSGMAMAQQQQPQSGATPSNFYSQQGPPGINTQTQQLYPGVPAQSMNQSGGYSAPPGPQPPAPAGMQHLLSGGPQMQSTMGMPGLPMVNGPMQPGMAAQPDYRPLNVKDALTYLDQVKFQFSDQPDVYNRFLDIMKDFKSQAIDTPGVIERVSTLFRGHPSLIVGFNTFLPPGYKIEVSQTAAGQTYTITTPDSQHYVNAYSGAPITFHQTTAGPFQQPAAMQPQQPTMQSASVKKTPVEFNHAINYVNKIKNRFVNDPDVYKQFLEILRTYQNESKPISEVYAQVQMLFRGNPDLLEEFKQFLPDTSAGAPSQAGGRQYQGAAQGGFQPGVQQAAYAKRGQMQPGAQRQTVFAPKGKRAMNGGAFQGGFSKKSRYDLARGPQKAYNHQFGAAEEFEFFEKVKKVLGNKQTYIEFLKVLNLFNQDIIDPKLLVEKVEPFLARVPELLDWFKVYVRYDDSHQIPEIVPTEPPNHDLSEAKRSGSSYRLLPNDYLQPPCSGRDSLCYEVLNDNWTCHPTWASEDGGFVAHKKNQFEESLYRCEEERYEFDLSIEANKSVIQRLEPIAKRIAEMTADEARAFKLPEGLGDGFSKTILRRVVKKVYDKDRGQEVLDSLIEHPAVAVPIVLKRLKQKDEEWRRNQREWSKIWREIDSKNFYKSLDHQGINFKVTDKKVTSSKALLTEIETVYRENHARPEGTLAKKHQMEYMMPSQAIMGDIKSLILSYLERAQYPPNEQERIHKFLNKFVEPFFSMPIEPADVNGAASNDRNTLYGNNSYYLFFRYFQIAYARLEKIREAADDLTMSSAGYRRLQNQKTAESLDLLTKNEPGPVQVDNGDIYKAFLALTEKVFENDIDPAVYEEQARFWFGTSAFVMYTVDRLFQHLAKQLSHIVTDPSCVKMFSLYLKERELTNDARRDAQYRRKADEIVDEEENLYKIEFVSVFPFTLHVFTREHLHQVFNRDALTLELLGDEDFAGIDESKNSEVQWTDYIDNYVKFGLTASQLQPCNRVFLNRTRTDPTTMNAEFVSVNNLECKISVNTYKMFFVENSEDSFYRKKPAVKEPADGDKEARKRRHGWMKKFLDSRANKVFGMTASEWTRTTQKLDKWFLQGDNATNRNSNHLSANIVEVFGVPCRQFISHAMRG